MTSIIEREWRKASLSYVDKLTLTTLEFATQRLYEVLRIVDRTVWVELKLGYLGLDISMKGSSALAWLDNLLISGEFVRAKLAESEKRHPRLRDKARESSDYLAGLMDECRAAKAAVTPATDALERHFKLTMLVFQHSRIPQVREKLVELHRLKGMAFWSFQQKAPSYLAAWREKLGEHLEASPIMFDSRKARLEELDSALEMHVILG